MNLPRAFPGTVFELARLLPFYVREIKDFEKDYSIGSGGNGTVFHAKDSRTGEEVAVKVLQEKDNKSNEEEYIHEVYSNAICSNRFVIKLVGFTIEKPYAIITGFGRGRTLDDLIYSAPKKKKNPGWARLTSIALGLSKALDVIASNGVIHRDIKASNIILDSKGLPFIGDFGIAEFDDGKSKARKGTPMYMAPETFLNQSITCKVDIFSFGMVLYEMSELHIAYQYLNSEEVYKMAKNRDEYPQFTSNTPKPLRKLIEKCWGPAEKRPSPKEIYEGFESGKVYFKDGDMAKLKKVVKMVKRKESEYSIDNTVQYVDVNSVIERIESAANQQQKIVESKEEEEVDINWDLVKNPTDKGFIPYLKSVPNILKTQVEKEMFLRSTIKIFGKNSSDELIVSTLDCFRVLMLRDHNFINSLFNEKLMYTLPSDSDDQMKASLEILAILFAFKPELVDSEMVTVIMQYISKFPEEMVIISSHYLKHINDWRARPVIDSLYNSNNLYISIDSGVNFLTIFYHVLQENSVYSSLNSEAIKSMIIKFAESDNMKVAACAYRIIAHTNSPLPDFTNVFDHLINNEMIEPILSVLLRCTEFPRSKRLCASLVELSKTNVKAFAVLLLFAKSYPVIVAKNKEWPTTAIPTVGATFKLLLLIYSSKEAKEMFIESNILPKCLRFLVIDCDTNVLTYLPPLIRRSDCDADLFKELESNGFINAFFERCAISNDTITIYNSITLITTIAEKCFVGSFIPEIERLKKFLGIRELYFPCITAFCSLSKYRECKRYLSAMEGFFSSLLVYEDYSVLASTILQNIRMQ